MLLLAFKTRAVSGTYNPSSPPIPDTNILLGSPFTKTCALILFCPPPVDAIKFTVVVSNKVTVLANPDKAKEKALSLTTICGILLTQLTPLNVNTCPLIPAVSITLPKASKLQASKSLHRLAWER